jgi:hypothetical protein
MILPLDDFPRIENELAFQRIKALSEFRHKPGKKISRLAGSDQLAAIILQ